nr:hypothetical protein [uncultured Campylobacter sp.]
MRKERNWLFLAGGALLSFLLPLPRSLKDCASLRILEFPREF